MLCGISSRFQLLSPSERQVAHALLTRSPLSYKIRTPKGTSNITPFDLHVLGTPPAFVLSQDQTLNDWYYYSQSCYNHLEILLLANTQEITLAHRFHDGSTCCLDF